MRRTKISDTSVRRPCGRVDGRPRPRTSDSDSFQQRKIQEFFIAMYLVLGKWCGFFVHKWRSLNSQKKILWIFCPQMTLTQIPTCGFFVHNFQIGVKWLDFFKMAKKCLWVGVTWLCSQKNHTVYFIQEISEFCWTWFQGSAINFHLFRQIMHQKWLIEKWKILGFFAKFQKS